MVLRDVQPFRQLAAACVKGAACAITPEAEETFAPGTALILGGTPVAAAHPHGDTKVFGADALARPDSSSGVVRMLARAKEDRLAWCWLLMVACVTGALCLPFLHFATLSGDEGLLFDGVQRMLLGHTIYRDFFEFLPPGSFIVTAGWLWMFGDSYVCAQSL
ncbi:MAG TPA: hypothetical protein VFN42_03410, partial [Acetobacteraceae bacterium]|nr:hypothetical protein [Acetobacteraceae bacterium]